MPEGNEQAGVVEKGAIDGDQALAPDYETTEVSPPSKGPLDLPAFSISS